MSYEPLVSIFILIFVHSVHSIFNCGCGKLTSRHTAYIEGDEMTLICTITNTDHLGGINSTHLYFVHGDNDKIETKILNNTSISLNKNVTLRDTGSYFCKIRTKKTDDMFAIRVNAVAISVLSLAKIINVECELHYWKKLECRWESKPVTAYLSFKFQLHSPNGSLCRQLYINRTKGWWDISDYIDTTEDKPWSLSVEQSFENRVVKIDYFEVFPFKYVIPTPVEDLEVQMITNKATCLNLKWSYDQYGRFRILFNISYTCLSCTDKYSTLVVDKPNIEVCDLEAESLYNFSVSVTTNSRYYSEPVTIETNTTAAKYYIPIPEESREQGWSKNDVISIVVPGAIIITLAAFGLCIIIRYFKIGKMGSCKSLKCR